MTPVLRRAVEAIRRGELVVVVDGADPDKAGKLVVAADAATPETVRFMALHGGGPIHMELDALGLEHLSVAPAAPATNAPADGNAAVTIGLRTPRGAAYADASVELVSLAGRTPAAITCMIVADDRSPAGEPSPTDFAKRHRLALVSAEAVVRFRGGPASRQLLSSTARGTQHPGRAEIERQVETFLPTRTGDWRAVGYECPSDHSEHVALVLAHIDEDAVPLVYVHVRCVAGDVFGSKRCACSRNLEQAMIAIVARGNGAVIYIDASEQPGDDALPGIGQLCHSAGDDARALTCDRPLQAESYARAAAILFDLKLDDAELLSDDPRTSEELRHAGIAPPRQVPLGFATARRDSDCGAAAAVSALAV